MKQPREYQLTAIKRGIEKNTIIADQMGLGKSLTAIEIAKAMFNQCNAPALIVCPKGLKLQWHQFLEDQDPNCMVWEISTLFDIEEMLIGETAVKIDYVIIHYEALVKFIGNKTLYKQIFSTLIVDEVHRIKRAGTRAKPVLRTQAVKLIKAYRKIGLSGTPIHKNPAEFWSLLNWIEPQTFPHYYPFVEDHITVDVDRFTGYETNHRLKDPQAFAAMLKPHMIRRKKSDVMPQLPPMIETVISIQLSPAQMKAYAAIKKPIDMEVHFDGLDDPLIIQNVLTKITRLLQVASDPITLGLSAPSAKLDWLREWLSDNPDVPVLIFSRYRETARHVFQTIQGDCLVMAGEPLRMTLSKAQRIVATIASLKEGHDLGHIETVIFIDRDWSSPTMDQAKERIDRGSNSEPKNVFYLDAIDTVDALVAKSLAECWNTKQLIDQFLKEVNEQYQPTNSGHAFP